MQTASTTGGARDTGAPRRGRWLRLADEALLPVMAGGFSVVYTALTAGLAPESTIFPRTIMTLMCVLGIAIIAAEVRAPSPPRKVRGPSQAPLILVGSLAYLIGFAWLGFIVAAPLFLLGTLLLLRQPVLRSILIAVGLPAAIYVLFAMILRIPL